MKHIFYVFIFLLIAACNNSVDRQETIIFAVDSEEVATIKQIKVSPNPHASTPFDLIDYDRVVAYDYGGEGEDAYSPIVDEKGNLHSSVINSKDLTQHQVDDLTNFLGRNETYGNSTAFCFEPHLGIVFYKEDKIKAHLSICLQCNLLRSSVEIPATQLKKMYPGTDNEFALEGFSKSGRQKIMKLCADLQFSHCRGYMNE